MTPKPQPVVVTTICSLCDESWEAHGDKPTTADCIRLLKERAQRAEARWPSPIYVQPYRPWWPYSTYIECNSTASGITTTTGSYTVNYSTPDEGDPPAAVAA